jgi:hypothetical protein
MPYGRDAAAALEVERGQQSDRAKGLNPRPEVLTGQVRWLR